MQHPLLPLLTLGIPHSRCSTPRCPHVFCATTHASPCLLSAPHLFCLPSWGRRHWAAALKSGRRPRARVLAGGLRLVTEGYIRSPPLPPTLLLDRGETPCRPRVDPVSTPCRPIHMYLAQAVQKMFKNIVFYSVSWPSADTTLA